MVTMIDMSPKEWLEQVKTHQLWLTVKGNLERQYRESEPKNEELEQIFRKQADERIGQCKFLALVWRDFLPHPDIEVVLECAWDELCKEGVSSSLIRYAATGMLIHQLLDQWFSSAEKTVKPAQKVQAAIPESFKTAEKDVFVGWLKKDSRMIPTRQQVRKAAGLIKVESNTQIALLMAICFEVGAIRSGTSCTDFVRALAGLGVLPFTTEKEVDKMADGVSKKLYGYRKGTTQYPPLPVGHDKWPAKDRNTGDTIYKAMVTL